MSQSARPLVTTLGPLVEDGAATILLVCLSVAALLFLMFQILAVLYPYPLDYGEAPLVDQAMRLAAGENIYRPDLSSPPYTISNYPPLYVLSMAPFVKMFGPSFGVGRVISSLCSLASGAFLGLIIYAYTQDRMAAVITALLFLAIPYVVRWSALARVDLLALALSTGGLYLLVRWPHARWSVAAAGLCLVAAIYTRQSYALAAPLAAFRWLWECERRRALRLAALVIGFCLTLFVLLNALTQGGLKFNIVTANVNEFDVAGLMWHLRQMSRVSYVLLILGGLYMIFAPGRLSSWALLVPFLIGAAFSSLTIGKVGSNVNYFLELCAALSLAAGALVAWSRKRPWVRAVLLLLLTLQTGRLMQAVLADLAEPLSSLRQSVKQLRELEAVVAAADGPVLADEYMGIITLQGRPLYIQPFEVTQLARAGVWDQTPLVNSIRDAEFSLILIHQPGANPIFEDRWTREMLSAIEQAYAPERSIADTYVYRPKDGLEAPD